MSFTPITRLPPEQSDQPAWLRRVDYALVATLRSKLAEELTDLVGQVGRGQLADLREQGRARITTWVAAWLDEQQRRGTEPISTQDERALVEALTDELFGLGRLQPLIDDVHVEDIEVDGFDRVWLQYDDGTVREGPPVADDDDQLADSLRHIVATFGRGRVISTSEPKALLRLPDLSRATVTLEVSARPNLVIRRHRLRESNLEDLQQLGMIDRVLTEFLRAAVTARLNTLVVGPMGAGKTTLLRALAAELHPLERIVTIETEYELWLHDMPDRHKRITAFEERPGSGELGRDGRPSGEVTMADLVPHALRQNASRLIVGEVRSHEVLPMLQAMTTGHSGSISTLHANSAADSLERLVTLCHVAGYGVQAAERLAAAAIDLVVNVRMIDETQLGGRKWRFVSEVIEVTGVGEGGHPSWNNVFVPGPDGRAVPGTTPARVMDLRRAGFDARLLDQPDGLWEQEMRLERPW